LPKRHGLRGGNPHPPRETITAGEPGHHESGGRGVARKKKQGGGGVHEEKKIKAA